MKPARRRPGTRRARSKVSAKEWKALLVESECLLERPIAEQAGEAPRPAPEALQEARHDAPEAPAEPGPLSVPKLRQGEFLEAMEAWR